MHHSNYYALNQKHGLTIGIDVGGTNTDAVLYDDLSGSIKADVKIPTAHEDYERSIEDAVKSLLDNSGTGGSEITSMNISTTLSTNALLERRGAPVNLILIGFRSYPHIVKEIESVIKPDELLHVSGGHTGWGKRKEALDEAAIESFAKKHRKELFAISSLYSPRNPEHEIKAKDIVISEGCVGITCGHELAHSRLNSVKRTLTAYLNSALMPVTDKLIFGIENVAKKHGLTCPLMFLRSDSSLVSSDWCRKFPLETIFSGPAASVRGARILSGLTNNESITVIDMGGTSTDIGHIENGRAVFSEEGAAVGSYRTMIPSLDIKTIALGGDSFVKIDEGGDILIGPDRSLPLCRASALEHICPDSLKSVLSELILNGQSNLHFIIKPSKVDELKLSGAELDLAVFLKNRPVLFEEIFDHMLSLGFTHKEAEKIIDQARRKGVVADCAYTPTDALVAAGNADIGDREISSMASDLFAASMHISSAEFAERVRMRVAQLLESAVSADQEDRSQNMRVYVGTPVKAFVSNTANEKNCIFPDKGEVASAVGAAASSLDLSCSVSILHRFSDEVYTAFLPQATISSHNLEELMHESEERIKNYILEQAEAMGYANADVRIEHSFYYLDKVQSPATLASVSLECKAFVHNA